MVRTGRLIHFAPQPLYPDTQGYTALAAKLSYSHPFFTRVEPITVWLNKTPQVLGQAAGLSRDISIRMGTFLLSLVSVVLLFFLARIWMGDMAAALAALYMALSPSMAAYDVSGLRETPYVFGLVGFSFFAFTPLGRAWLRPLGMGVFGAFTCLTRLNALLMVVLVSGISLVRGTSWRYWKPWFLTLLIIGVFVGPFVGFVWMKTGDPFHTLNRHTHWYISLDPAFEKATTFLEYFFRELGPAKLVERTMEGMFRVMFGDIALDFFFNRQILPLRLHYVVPYVAYFLYLTGMCAAVWEKRWELFLMIILIAGPMWPLIPLGTDDRLLLGAMPFFAVFIGLGAEICMTFLMKLRAEPA